MLKQIFDISEGVLRFAIYISILIAGCSLAVLFAYLAILFTYRFGQAAKDAINLLFGISQESIIWLTLLNF
jgi:hypothetical protein